MVQNKEQSLCHMLKDRGQGKSSHSDKGSSRISIINGPYLQLWCLRLVNFAACAPYIRETGRKGMTSGMVQCQHYWDELSKDRKGHIYESERILDKLQGTSIECKLPLFRTVCN